MSGYAMLVPVEDLRVGDKLIAPNALSAAFAAAVVSVQVMHDGFILVMIRRGDEWTFEYFQPGNLVPVVVPPAEPLRRRIGAVVRNREFWRDLGVLAALGALVLAGLALTWGAIWLIWAYFG